MKTSRFTDRQIIAVLKQAEAGSPVLELCREHGISNATGYKWHSKFGGMVASLMARMKMEGLPEELHFPGQRDGAAAAMFGDDARQSGGRASPRQSRCHLPRMAIQVISTAPAVTMGRTAISCVSSGALRSPLDLGRLPCLAMSTVDGWSSVEPFSPNKNGFKFRHQPCFAADDADTLKCLILDGIGIGDLPAHLCRAELEQGRLVDALPDWSSMPKIFRAVFPSRRRMVPAIRALLDFLGENAKEGIGGSPLQAT